MDDVLIVGGGVIGLALAYELAGDGVVVRVVERGAATGQEASWAGAGILPPGNRRTATDAYSALHGLSFELHGQWAARLRDETGIDTGFRRCGGLYLSERPSARRPPPGEGRGEGASEQLSPGENSQLLELALFDWQQREIRAERLTYAEARALEPALAPGRDPQSLVVHLPDEAQLRNPWHLRALAAACRKRGVAIECGVAIEGFEQHAGRITAAVAADGRRAAEHICLTGGAWTARLVATLGIELPLRPIRGQIALLHSERALVSRVINLGSRYLVPRGDGRVLVGSTEEDAGFDKSITEEAIAELRSMAEALVPELTGTTLEKSWAGLRPCTPDGMPYLGRLPGIDNATLAAGHFRSGLTLSTGTARVMSQLIRDQATEVDLRAFRIDRPRS